MGQTTLCDETIYRELTYREKMEQAHKEKYAQFAEQIGVEKIVGYLKYFGITAEMVKKALDSGDTALNTIPLAKWDSICFFPANPCIWGGTREMGIVSISMRVCLLKHVARWHLAKEASDG